MDVMWFQRIRSLWPFTETAKDVVTFLLGLLVPLTFSPYDQWWLIFPILATFFYLCLACSPTRALLRGWLFGLSQFALGFYWIYYIFEFSNLNIYSALVVLLLFSAFQAIFPALCAFVAVRYFPYRTYAQLVLVMPMLWAMSEWLRSGALLGTPWSMMGYTQVDTYLSGYAPVIGVLGVSYIVAVCSGLLALLIFHQLWQKKILLTFAAIWVIGWGLSFIPWSSPSGAEIQVSLIQGNIIQEKKWVKDIRQTTLDLYRAEISKEWGSDLIVLPETAIPDSLGNVTDYLGGLRVDAEKNKTDVLLGIVDGDIRNGSYYNTMLSLRGGNYNKRHLIPFGEYNPWPNAPVWIRNSMEFLMAGFIVGAENQKLITVAGQEIGSSICYEVAYASEILKSMPTAKLLVNISNDAPFRKSTEPYLHQQVARMRAIETRRFVLRASNTGFSSIINSYGENIALSRLDEQTVIRGEVQPLIGMTPFALWGEKPILYVFLIILLFMKIQTKFRVTNNNKLVVG